jgi:hypothetical protein
MTPQPRTLVAVMANGADQQTHTLYFSDGTVVGYDPTLARVLRVHRLPADLGEPQDAVVEHHRRTPIGALAAVVLPSATLPEHADRRHEPRE